MINQAAMKSPKARSNVEIWRTVLIIFKVVPASGLYGRF